MCPIYTLVIAHLEHSFGRISCQIESYNAKAVHRMLGMIIVCFHPNIALSMDCLNKRFEDLL